MRNGSKIAINQRITHAHTRYCQAKWCEIIAILSPAHCPTSFNETVSTRNVRIVGCRLGFSRSHWLQISFVLLLFLV